MTEDGAEGRHHDADELAYGAALVALGISPARLRRLMEGRLPSATWAALAAGVHPVDPTGSLAQAVRRTSPPALSEACRRAGVTVRLLGAVDYPEVLAGDHQAPAVLFERGDHTEVGRRPRVAVVGTRSASAGGLQMASELGGALAEMGVVVVSGLAPGIDCAALRGAVEAHDGRALAVLGSAHDGLASASQRRLAVSIADRGALWSEVAPGTPMAKWRFAVRNRIMAAASQAVVVVESHEQGGVWYTVRAARARGVPVGAVPGSVRAPSCRGSNELLAQGAHCIRSADDVLRLIGRQMPAPPATTSSTLDVSGDAAAVLGLLGGDPVHVDAIVVGSRLPPPAVALALEELAGCGLAARQGGWWWRQH